MDPTACGDPAVVCAAPAVVPGPSGRFERDLHDPVGAACATRHTIDRWDDATGETLIEQIASVGDYLVALEPIARR
jgi:hypothetical protein